ncbi:MAG TPA: D-alanine--D-alanine ligase family protein [Nocardioidaceae bacterium]|nr:D-alanine--D-alanine ligase family protein [Nocardioidaceae bacterium]
MNASLIPSTRSVDDTETRKPRIAVVFGGRSSEHAISCVTAGSVLRAIDTDRYEVVPVGITHDGRWVLESGDPERLAITSADKLPEVDPTRSTVALANDASTSQLVVSEPSSVPRTLGEVDVVFPLLHGPWGEDGTIQGLLEMAGVRYVGAGVLASAVGMDKHYMKIVLQAQGLPVLPYTVITPRLWETDRAACHESVDSLGFPVFVKPCRGGSSIGISKVHDRTELAAAVEEARRHDPKVLVEIAAEGGREVECGVIEGFGDNPPDASVVAEITVGGGHEFYDFAAKYLPEEHTELAVPADLTREVSERVQQLAVDAFDALSCEGLARVDFFVLPDERVVINEINTMPGFTPSSMFPRMWSASGLDYPELVDRLIQLALHRDTGLR